VKAGGNQKAKGKNQKAKMKAKEKLLISSLGFRLLIPEWVLFGMCLWPLIFDFCLLPFDFLLSSPTSPFQGSNGLFTDRAR